MIVGEFLLVYNEIIIISLVMCWVIGIGVYFVWLGQRIIQVENFYLILIGVGVFNKVFGWEVYIFNNQFGGIQIMYNNGVIYCIVCDDFEGVFIVLYWLFYMFKSVYSLVFFLNLKDFIDRIIEFVFIKVLYDF